MRLITFELEGYKRFVRPNKVNLDGRVVAIVGANEAGKSSLLQALTHLNDDRPILHEEISHGADPPDDHPVVRGRFLLDDADRQHLGDIPGSAAAKWFVFSKSVDGTIRSRIEPRLERDLRPRLRTRRDISRVRVSPWLRSLGDQAEDLTEALAEVESTIATSDQSLPGAALEECAELAALLEETEARGPVAAYIEQLPERLRELIEHEKEEAPDVLARRRLWTRSPLFLQFTEESRSLKSAYDLREVADDPPVAIRNIANLGGLNLKTLLAYVDADDYPEAETLVDAANIRLREVFGEAWRQSKVAVRFGLHDTTLRVYIAPEGSRYTSIAERSDGLQAFVALIAFLAAVEPGHPPILLIDEAEMHLHYDAQADLVRMLTKQRAAAQVFYTTHSAGCLPQDLGTGIRLISQVTTENGDPASETRDQFWTSGPGLAPLLIGMGASTFALTPARYAVIVEGPSDLILLPSLLSEVTGLDDLGFQVAPGTAAATDEVLKQLEMEGLNVAYLVDGDDGGRSIAKRLRRRGVPDARIVFLGGQSQGVAIEDTLKKTIYAEAVNYELEKSHPDVRLQLSDVPARRRAHALDGWCKQRGVKPPTRVAVAYATLARRWETTLVDSHREGALRQAYRDLSKCLDLSAPPRRES